MSEFLWIMESFFLGFVLIFSWRSIVGLISKVCELEKELEQIETRLKASEVKK